MGARNFKNTSYCACERKKNPKRVAAGKAMAARTKKGREEQKKAAEAAGFVPTQLNKALPNEEPTAPTRGKQWRHEKRYQHDSAA